MSAAQSLSSICRVAPYAGPDTAGTKPSPGVSPRPTTHSISTAALKAIPYDRAASATTRRSTVRPHAGCGSPSWVIRSTGAHAQPGCADRTVTRSRSGYRRRSPSGDPRTSVVTIASFARKVSKTGDMPTPHAAAEASFAVGTVFTRPMPAVST